MESAVIVDVVRTASGRGKPGGALAAVHPADLLAQTLRHLVERSDLDPGAIDDVIVGCVGQVGDQAINIGRTATLAAGFPESVPATTIDRQCGSSQQAAHFAAQAVMAGVQDVVIACGVESMSRVPIGTAIVPGSDPMLPLRGRYEHGTPHQGIGAELVAARWGLSREEIDQYAAESHRRAAESACAGAFDQEIVPVSIPTAGTHILDETIRPGTGAAGLSQLRPAFQNDAAEALYPEVRWSITAGNSSPLTDGASAALIMSERRAAELGLTPRARFHTMSVVGSDPIAMLDGVIPATRHALKRSGLTLDDIDVYEVNEAFASIPLAWLKELGADPARLNPRGGAIALGHALGASGTRILGTLLNQLEATGGRLGLQTMCEGGGMANATIIERL